MTLLTCYAERDAELISKRGGWPLIAEGAK
jgi:hypothetical protein